MQNPIFQLSEGSNAKYKVYEAYVTKQNKTSILLRQCTESRHDPRRRCLDHILSLLLCLLPPKHQFSSVRIFGAVAISGDTCRLGISSSARCLGLWAPIDANVVRAEAEAGLRFGAASPSLSVVPRAPPVVWHRWQRGIFRHRLSRHLSLSCLVVEIERERLWTLESVYLYPVTVDCRPKFVSPNVTQILILY